MLRVQGLGFRVSTYQLWGVCWVFEICGPRSTAANQFESVFLTIGAYTGLMLPRYDWLVPRHDRQQNLRVSTITLLLFASATLLIT